MPRFAMARILPIVSRKDRDEKVATTKPDEKASLPRATAIRAAKVTKRRGVIIMQDDSKLVAQFSTGKWVD